MKPISVNIGNPVRMKQEWALIKIDTFGDESAGMPVNLFKPSRTLPPQAPAA